MDTTYKLAITNSSLYTAKSKKKTRFYFSTVTRYFCFITSQVRKGYADYNVSRRKKHFVLLKTLPLHGVAEFHES